MWQVDNTLKPKRAKFGDQIQLIIEGNIHFCIGCSNIYGGPCTLNNNYLIEGGGNDTTLGEDGTRFNFTKAVNSAGSLSVKRGQIPLLFYI